MVSGESHQPLAYMANGLVSIPKELEHRSTGVVVSCSLRALPGSQASAGGGLVQALARRGEGDQDRSAATVKLS